MNGFGETAKCTQSVGEIFQLNRLDMKSTIHLSRFFFSLPLHSSAFLFNINTHRASSRFAFHIKWQMRMMADKNRKHLRLWDTRKDFSRYMTSQHKLLIPRIPHQLSKTQNELSSRQNKTAYVQKSLSMLGNLHFHMHTAPHNTTPRQITPHKLNYNKYTIYRLGLSIPLIAFFVCVCGVFFPFRFR